MYPLSSQFPPFPSKTTLRIRKECIGAIWNCCPQGVPSAVTQAQSRSNPLKHLILVVCAGRVMQVPTVLQLTEVWFHLLLLFAMLADP
jgi:hypothetical protein